MKSGHDATGFCRLPAAAALCFAWLPATEARAFDQTLADLLRQEFEASAARSQLGNAFQALALFSSTPGISAAAYRVNDDGDKLYLNSYKLSPSHTFDPIDSLYGISPYIEGTLGYLDTDQKLNFAAFDTRAAVDIETFSFLGGAGVDIEIADGAIFRPIFLAGYAHISDSADVTGRFAPEFDYAGRGIVFDARIESFLLGGAAELEYVTAFGNDINFFGNLRYNHFSARVVSASNPVLETDSNFGVFTAAAEFDGPSGLTLFDREVRWIGFGTNTYLPGDPGDSLGFSYFFELGGGVELVDRNVVSGVEGISIRSSAILGENVVGWTVGLSLEF